MMFKTTARISLHPTPRRALHLFRRFLTAAGLLLPLAVTGTNPSPGEGGWANPRSSMVSIRHSSLADEARLAGDEQSTELLHPLSTLHSGQNSQPAGRAAADVTAWTTPLPVNHANTSLSKGRRAAASAPTAPLLIAPGKPRTLWMMVTAYCPCPKCCGLGARGVTASGKPVTYHGGKFVAADTDLLPFGTRLEIPGYNDSRLVEVIDRGSAIRGRRLDVYFPTHSQAKAWGRRWIAVTEETKATRETVKAEATD